jgi:hypothetical protein
MATDTRRLKASFEAIRRRYIPIPTKPIHGRNPTWKESRVLKASRLLQRTQTE